MPLSPTPQFVIIDEDNMSHVAKRQEAKIVERPDPFNKGQVMTVNVADVLPEPNALEYLSELPSVNAGDLVVRSILSDPEVGTPWVVLPDGRKLFWIPYWMTEEFGELGHFYTTHYRSLGESAIPHVLLIVPSGKPKTSEA